MSNIQAGRLNFFVYMGNQPMRLKGVVQSGETSGATVFTSARARLVYQATSSGFVSYNPANPTFSPLELLQPGQAYAVEALQTFEVGEAMPPANTTFRNNLRAWFTDNKPNPSPGPSPGPSPSPGGGSGARALGLNLTSIADWESATVFKDWFTRARWGFRGGQRVPWLSQADGQPWEQGGPLALDANGWVTSLNVGQSAWTPLLLEGTKPDGTVVYPTGQYVITWDGQGTITNPLSSISVVSEVPGRRVINYTGGDMWLAVTATTPGNHVRNIKVFRPQDESTLTSDPFTQAFLDTVSGFRAIRFMDWGHTNNSTLTTWAERTRLNSYSQASHHGVALEHMYDLCNRINANLWYCIPERADDNYIRQAAIMFRDNFRTDRLIYIEYSNEIWNGMFSAGGWCLARANEQGIPGSDFDKICRYHGRRLGRIRQIFSEEFGSAFASRVRIVAGSQAGNTGVTDIILNWNDPTFGLIREQVDHVAIAPYFNGFDSNALNPSATNFLTLAQLQALTDPEILTRLGNALTESRSFWTTIRNSYSNSRGPISVIGYEAGQHLNPVSYSNPQAAEVVLRRINLMPEFEQVYRNYYLNWFNDMGNDALICQFSDCSWGGIFGFWGFMRWQTETLATSPKGRGLRHVLSGGN